MRVDRKNLCYAMAHPSKTLRYLRWQDKIPYHVIAHHLPVDPVIVEARAADGSNTREMAEWWPRAVIHAFGPVPGARTLLERNVVSVRDLVRVWPVALGDVAGSFGMHVSGNGDASDRSLRRCYRPRDTTKSTHLWVSKTRFAWR